MRYNHGNPVNMSLYENEIRFIVKAVKEKANKTNEDVSELIKYLDDNLFIFVSEND